MTCFTAPFAYYSVSFRRKYSLVRCESIREKYSVLFAIFRKGFPQGFSSCIVSFSDMTSYNQLCSSLDSKPYLNIITFVTDKGPHFICFNENFSFAGHVENFFFNFIPFFFNIFLKPSF